MMADAVKKGDKVKVHYTGTLDNGDKFDSSEGRDPLEFVSGTGQIIKGFDNAVIGMKKGEEKEITIPPQEAYGERREELKQEVEKSKFPPEMKIEKGATIGMRGPQGQVIPLQVVDVKGDKVVLDLNHPLAGKTLHFKIKVVDFEAA